MYNDISYHLRLTWWSWPHCRDWTCLWLSWGWRSAGPVSPSLDSSPSSLVWNNASTLLLVTLICDSLEVRHGLLQVRPPGQGGQGPGVGLHVIGAEQQQRGQVVAAHDVWCLGPRCDWQPSPAQLLGINHNLYTSPPPLPYLQTQN